MADIGYATRGDASTACQARVGRPAELVYRLGAWARRHWPHGYTMLWMAAPYRNLIENLATGWSLGLPPFSPTQEQEESFDRHIAVVLARSGRFIVGWAVVMCILFWPTDLILFQRVPATRHAFTTLRICLIVTSVVTLLGLWRRPAISVRMQAVFVAPWLVTCGALAYCLGTLGGLDKPWFHFTYPFVLAPVFFPLRPGWRILFSSLIAVALLSGFALAHPDLARSPFFPSTLVFMVFITMGSIALGQLLFLLSRSNFFQAQEVKRYAADLSAQVAEQTKELRQVTVYLGEALEAERAHISRELHDELGQELTAMRYELRFARQRFEQDPASIRGNLANLEDLVLRTARTTRAIVTDLRPRILDDMGLSAAAEWLVERTGQRTGIPCHIQIDGKEPPGPPDEVAIAAFRVLQESLTNAARHAAASRIDVLLQLSATAIELSVRDDGVGLDTAAGRSGGMGLLGMRERARALGGQFTIESGRERGTEIRCRLPLARPRSPAAAQSESIRTGL